jgi:hypothetical protein
MPGPIVNDYVVFHNAEKMGEPLRRGRRRKDASLFGIVTAKKEVLKCVGDTVWLIQGIGRPRRYTLECRFVIEEVEDNPDPEFDYCATGTDGIVFDPPIPLSLKDRWFRRFYDLQNHFSLGFQSIDTRTLRTLETLAREARAARRVPR